MKLVILFILTGALLAISCRKSSVSDSNITDIQVPAAFTPGGPSNSNFMVHANKAISNYSIKIYDTKNNSVYNSNDINKGWDGSYDGKAQPAGPYNWIIGYTSESGDNQSLTGYVELIR